MVKRIFIAFFVLSTITAQVQAKSLSKTLWPDLDINNPELSKNTVMLQCQKSLMYAPRQLEEWCEKAYDMGEY